MRHRGRLVVILGGQKSGKSSHAARLAHATGAPVCVVAPAVPRDPEFEARVRRHQQDRPPHWRTIERFDLEVVVAEVAGGDTVVIDALDTWLAETLLDLDVDLGDEGPTDAARRTAEVQVGARLERLATAAHQRSGTTIVVAGQPGLGPHAIGAGARAYVDLHGLGLQRLVAAADEAVLMVAGRALPLPPPAPDQAGPDRQAGPAAVEARLREHGDTQVPAGCVDLAVNVEPGPPTWLADELRARVDDLAAYPDDRPAREAAARRHGRSVDACAIVAGGAEALWLLPRVLDVRLAACVHPSFTEPEAALRAAGVPVVRVQRDPDDAWRLDPTQVPDAADLVVLGRPDNPTGALADPDDIARLCRPGRVVVVDEAFAEFLPDAGGLAARTELPGLVSVRSLTKLWGLAGLRVGYVVGPPRLIQAIASVRQPWSTSNLALHALERLVGREDERRDRAQDVARRRRDLVTGLLAVPGLKVWASPANYVLLCGDAGLRDALLDRGLAVRRGDTFPGLDDRWVRVAVRDPATNRRLVDALLDHAKVHR